MRALFSQFSESEDADAEINAASLHQAFKKFGWANTNEEEIDKIMKEHDLDGNMSISF